MSQNIDALDTVNAKLASSKAIIELLISNYDGTVSDGSFQIAQGTIHEAHAALSDLLGAAKNAASTISFAGLEK